LGTCFGMSPDSSLKFCLLGMDILLNRYLLSPPLGGLGG
jgi:hypothetical protein